MLKAKPAKKAKKPVNQAIAVAVLAAKALVAAECLQIKTKAVTNFPLSDAEQIIVCKLPLLGADIKKKLVQSGGDVTIDETARIVLSVAEHFLDLQPKQQAFYVAIAEKLIDCLQANINLPVLQE